MAKENMFSTREYEYEHNRFVEDSHHILHNLRMQSHIINSTPNTFRNERDQFNQIQTSPNMNRISNQQSPFMQLNSISSQSNESSNAESTECQ